MKSLICTTLISALFSVNAWSIAEYKAGTTIRPNKQDSEKAKLITDSELANTETKLVCSYGESVNDFSTRRTINIFTGTYLKTDLQVYFYVESKVLVVSKYTNKFNSNGEGLAFPYLEKSETKKDDFQFKFLEDLSFSREFSVSIDGEKAVCSTM